MMTKPDLSVLFTIDDIHKLREYNYEITKGMSDKDKMNYYNEKGLKAHKIIEEMKRNSSLLNSLK